MYSRNKFPLAVFFFFVYTFVYTYIGGYQTQATSRGFLPMDTTIQNALNTAREAVNIASTAEDMYKSMNNGNIYTNAYKLAKQEEDAAHVQAIAALTTEINGVYNCGLNSMQIERLTKDGGETVTALACLPLINCFAGKRNTLYNFATERVQYKENNIPTSQRMACQSFIKQNYQQKYTHILGSTTLASVTLGTDIYANGSLDDAPFDILYDIQKIGDVLFSENEETVKTLFFTFPQGSIAGVQAISFGDDYNTNIFPTTNGGIVSPGISNPTINPTQNTIPGGNTPGGGQNQTTPGSPGDNQGIQGDGGSEGETETTVTRSDPTLNASNNSNIINYMCIAQPNTQTSSPTTPGSPGDNQGTQGDGGSEGETDGTRLEDRDTRPTKPEEGVTTSQNETVNSLLNSDNWADSNSLINNEQQVKKCIAKCEGSNMKAVDKAFCIAECTCGTTRSPEGMFGVSVCLVPSRSADVISSKPIPSVQEVIKEINTVLLALRQSGQLLKHNKTTEFLDTSLAKIQFNKIFAFDVNFARRPVFPVVEKTTIQNTAKVETETDRMENGTYADIQIAKEKNKYAYYWNNTQKDTTTNKDALGEPTISDWDNTLTTTPQDTTQSLSKTQNAEIVDSVRLFLQDNIEYRDRTMDVIRNIQSTSSSIRQKIK